MMTVLKVNNVQNHDHEVLENSELLELSKKSYILGSIALVTIT